MPCGRGWGGWSCRTGGATGYRWCVGPTRHFFWCHGLRIAWIIAGDEIGGVAQAVRGLTKAVPAQGIEPLFISLADGPFVEELRARGHTVAVLGNFHFPVLQGSFGEKLATLPAMQQATASTLPSLAAELGRSQAQATHFLWPNLLPLVGRAARRASLPTFWEMPNVLGRYPFAVNRRITQFNMWRYGIVCLANSEYTAGTVGGWPVRPVVLYPGADPARFVPGATESITRAALGVKPGAVVLAMIGRVTPAKGQAVLLRALADMAAEHPDLHALIVGGAESAEYLREIKGLADKPTLRGRVHIVGATAEPERYYGVVDIAVSAYSGAEGFGLSVVEAMLAGKPVLAHALGGPAETVVDGVTGWHVKAPTVEAFRNGIQRALADRPRWAKMGAAGRARALQYFSLPVQAARYAEIVRAHMGEASPPQKDAPSRLEPPPEMKQGVGSGRGTGAPSPRSLTDQTANGFLWMLVQTVGSKIFSFGTQIVLARLLAPRDFGLIALAYGVVAMSAVIRNTGIQQILVQRQKHFRRWANPAFWFELAVSLATALMLVVAAPIAGAAFRNHTLVGLILVIAAAMPLNPWYVVPSAKLMIDMRFKALAAVNVGYNLIAMAASVLLAWRGFGAYSFAIPLPVACIARAVWLWRLAPPPVGFRPQIRRWRFLIADSGYMLSTGFILNVMSQTASLALGFYYTKAAVGQFFLAFNLSSQIQQVLSQNLGSVLLPALAKLQEDRPRQVAALLRASRMLAFLGIPLCLLLAAVAKPFIAVAYGARWSPAAPVLQLLAIATALSVPGSLSYAALQSQGRFRLMFLYTLLQSIPFVAAVLAGARLDGPLGAAAGWLIVTVVFAPGWTALACSRSARPSDIGRVYLGPFAAGGLALVPALAMLWFWPEAGSHHIAYGLMAAVSMGILYPPFAWVFCRAELGQSIGHLTRLASRLGFHAGRV